MQFLSHYHFQKSGIMLIEIWKHCFWGTSSTNADLSPWDREKVSLKVLWRSRLQRMIWRMSLIQKASPSSPPALPHLALENLLFIPLPDLDVQIYIISLRFQSRKRQQCGSLLTHNFFKSGVKAGVNFPGKNGVWQSLCNISPNYHKFQEKEFWSK